MQNVSEMHDRDDKPPPGGKVVSVWLQPGAGSAGIGTVVATPDGIVVVVVAGTVVVVAVAAGASLAEARPMLGDAGGKNEHPQPATARTARETVRTSRLCATFLPRMGSRCPTAPVVASA
jgi:hypothetical protein